MARILPRFGLLLLGLALLLTMACSDKDSGMTEPSVVTTFNFQPSFTAQPATLSPEFLPGVACGSSNAFGTRIIVVVNGGSSVFLSGMNFRFIDRFGVTALPQVRAIPGPVPMTTPSVSIPTSNPIPPLGVAPLPTSAPIPFPANGNPTVLDFPFFLTFGCGVFSQGTLIVNVDTDDSTGRRHRSEFSVALGS